MRILSDEFESKENKVKQELCRKSHSREEKIEVLTRWKDFMEEISAKIPFFEYFENLFQWHKKSCVLIKTNWTKETREVVQSSHPPQETITIKHQNVKVVASPFKISTDEEKLVKKVIEQNNYTNQCLDVIGKQLDRIENKVGIQPSSPVQTLEKPLIRLLANRQASLKSKDKTTLEIVNQRLENLVKKELGSSSNPKVTEESPQRRTIVTLGKTLTSSQNSSEFEKDDEHLETQFESLQVNKLHKSRVTPTSLTKNWYPRLTPPNLQFEERNLSNQFSVSSDKLYEWNIDGFLEKEILNKIQHISMVANNYLNNGHTHTEVVELLVLGFIRKLLSWWDK